MESRFGGVRRKPGGWEAGVAAGGRDCWGAGEEEVGMRERSWEAQLERVSAMEEREARGVVVLVIGG